MSARADDWDVSERYFEQMLAPTMAINGQPDARRGAWRAPRGEPRDPIAVSHSWLPVPLVGTPPVEPPSICGLLYPGKRHLLSGESDAGKSMVLHYWQAEEIRAGHCVLHLDFEQGQAETLQRLLALGLTEHEIEQSFIYVSPDEPVGDLLPDLLAVIEDRRPTIVSFDSFGNLAELHGLSDNDRQDVGRIYRTIIEPTIQYGAAAVALDHLAKAPGPAKYAIGSERKIGIPDVHLRVACAVPLARGRKGVVNIVGMRDRSGYLRKGKLAEITLHSDDSGRIRTEIVFVEDDEAGKVWRPTDLMERVSRHLESLVPAGASQNAIERDVIGNAKHKRQTLNLLVADGYVTEARDGQARVFTSVKPFREGSE